MTTKRNHHSNTASYVSVRQLRGSARSYFLFHLLVSSICFVSSPDEIYDKTHPAVEAFKASLQPLCSQGVPRWPPSSLPWVGSACAGCGSMQFLLCSVLACSLFRPHSCVGKPAVWLVVSSPGLVSSHLQFHGSPRLLRLHCLESPYSTLPGMHECTGGITLAQLYSRLQSISPTTSTDS